MGPKFLRMKLSMGFIFLGHKSGEDVIFLGFLTELNIYS